MEIDMPLFNYKMLKERSSPLVVWLSVTLLCLIIGLLFPLAKIFLIIGIFLASFFILGIIIFCFFKLHGY